MRKFTRLFELCVGLAGLACAQTIPVTVKTQLVSNSPTTMAVNAWIQNTGKDTLRNLTYVWYMDWTDHGSPLVAELDYASVSGVTAKAVQRPDYIAEARYDLGANKILPGQTVQLQTRFHLKDWTAFQASNDWSFAGLKGTAILENSFVSVFSGGARIWGRKEEYLGPTLAAPVVKVRTIPVSVASNALGLEVHLVNTGTVPVTGLVARWVGSTLGRTAPVVAELDYSNADSVKLRTMPVSGTRTEMAIDLGTNIVGVGLEKVVKLRLHSSDWTNVDWTQDWSYAGVSQTAYNDRMEIEVQGYPVTGILPQDTDTDHDGWADAVEIALGTNPNDASSHPVGATMTGAMVQDTSTSHLVTYNASSLSGYSTRTSLPLTIDPGAVSGLAPVISLAPVGTPKPVFNQAIQIGKTFEISGSIRPGHTLTVPVPLPDGIAASLPRNIQVVHYVNGKWQSETVTEIKNGAAYTVLSSFSPVAVGLVQQETFLSAGDGHALWNRKGRPWSAGANDRGQLGNRSTASQTGFGAVYWPSTTPVVAVAAGARHSLALDASGSVWAWGDNQKGQCGQAVTGDSTRDYVVQPVLVIDATADPSRAVTQIASGDNSSYAVTISGQILTWGDNFRSQLGDGKFGYSVPFDPVPRLVVDTLFQPLDSFVQVAAGAGHAIALRYDGVMLAWGANNRWQKSVGIVDYTNRPYAQRIRFSVADYGADTIHVGGCQGPNGTGCWSLQLIRPWYAAPSLIAAKGDMSYAKLYRYWSEDRLAKNLVWGGNDSGQIVPGGPATVANPTSVTGFGRGDIALGRFHLVQDFDNGFSYYGPPINSVLHLYPVQARGANGAGQSDPVVPGGTTPAWKDVTRPGMVPSMISSAVAAGRNFSMSYDYGADSVYVWGGSWGRVQTLTKTDGSFLEIVSPRNGDSIPSSLDSASLNWRLWKSDGTFSGGTGKVSLSACTVGAPCALNYTVSGQSAGVKVVITVAGIASTPIQQIVDRAFGQQLGFSLNVRYPADSASIFLWRLRPPRNAIFRAKLGALSVGKYSIIPANWLDSIGNSVAVIPDGSYGYSVVYHALGGKVWDTSKTTVGERKYIPAQKIGGLLLEGGPDSFAVFAPAQGVLHGYLKASIMDFSGLLIDGSWELRMPGLDTMEVWNVSDSTKLPLFDTLPYPIVDWAFREVKNGLKLIGGNCAVWVGTNSHSVSPFLSELPMIRFRASKACNEMWQMKRLGSQFQFNASISPGSDADLFFLYPSVPKYPGIWSLGVGSALLNSGLQYRNLEVSK